MTLRSTLDASMTEAQLQAAVIELAELLGYLVFHSGDSRRDTGAGFPDLTMVKPPRLVFAELKRQGRYARPDQRAWLDALDDSGAEAYVWRPEHWSSGFIERVLRRES